MTLPFKNRQQAGEELARALKHHAGTANTIVLALPRGGVPVAVPIARALSAPLDVLLVRKLGCPGHAELAMGAIASGQFIVRNEEVIRERKIPEQAIDQVIRTQQAELARRDTVYRGHRPMPDLHNRPVILVDDGLATGATLGVAIKAVQSQQPAKIIVAIPVGAADSVQRLSSEVDELVCLYMPAPFFAIGQWYLDFDQVSDQAVCEALSAFNLTSPT